MRPKQLAQLLDHFIRAAQDGKDVPALHVQGEPGVGKSAIVHQACARSESLLLEHHLLFKEPVDFSGVPTVENGRTRWCPPIDLVPDNLPDHVVLLLEELAQLEPPMQKACGPIVWDRRFGIVPLPPRTMIVTTGNRIEDKAGAFRLLGHLRKRLIVINLESHVDDLLEWGLTTGRLANPIRLYLTFKRTALHDAPPRSWELASQALAICPTTLRQEVLAGALEPGPASEFMAFVEVCEKLPDLKNVLRKPETSPIPEELSVIYATVGSLAELVMESEPDLQQAAAVYACRFPKEYATLFMQCCCFNLKTKGKEQVKAFTALPRVKTWIRDNVDALIWSTQ